MVFLSSAAAAGWHSGGRHWGGGGTLPDGTLPGGRLLGVQTQSGLGAAPRFRVKHGLCLSGGDLVMTHNAGAVQLGPSAFLSLSLYLLICLFSFYSINHTQEYESKMPCSQATYLLQAFQNLFPKDCIF